jgi:peptidoglycan hydrolase-like protein with peptidoglycan-binding domain
MKKHSDTKTARWSRPLLVIGIFAGLVQGAFADDDVAAVQKALKLKHFYYGEVDGNFDCATQGALRRFQFRNGLPGTGEMDGVTVQALTGAAPAANSGSAAMFARTVRDRDLGLENQRAESSAEVKAVTKVEETRRLSAVPEATKKQRSDVHTGYAEQFPSWSAQHRVFLEDGVEVRRAIPVAPKTNNEEKLIPRAIPVATLDETPSREVLIAEVGHFTGQDGHVYTYTRKVRTVAPDASFSPASRFADDHAGSAPRYGSTAVSNVAVSTWPPDLTWTQTR